MFGDVFFEFADVLRIYSSYVNDYDDSIRFLGTLKDNPKWVSFWNDEIKKQAEWRKFNLELSSFLIMPIQRIPRYIMLLRDLYKNTPKQHGDHQILDVVVKKIEDVADYLNTNKSEKEALNKMMQLQSLVTNYKPRLLVAGRKLVKEGVMLIFSDAGSSYCTLFLFTDLLLVTQELHKRRGEPEYRCLRSFDLNHCKLSAMPDTLALKNSWVIADSEDNHATLYTSIPAVRDEWMNAIYKVIEQLKTCLLYTSPSPRDRTRARMPSSA
eukprot:TRINITY_DN6935_c0_g1_i2.p1 TRINITY_DN6935_c0_g1~~TRINITY_DN6935_c0_g1_i2.p1  ORF type:complete len:268 (+),score=50.87 TRINITY_DN6935_c0_g1_i2:210-1013(+)